MNLGWVGKVQSAKSKETTPQGVPFALRSLRFAL
jgi:hypothetical protein